MTCLEARREFAGFWRRSLPEADRGALLAHLWGCASCDHAFRVFALTAPVLHGAPPSGRVERSSALPNLREPRTASSPAANVVDERRRMLVAAFMMGVAAAVALYFSTSPRVTLEDAINGAGAAVVVTNPNNNSLFGMDDIGRDSTLDESKLDFGEGRDHGFAG